MACGMQMYDKDGIPMIVLKNMNAQLTLIQSNSKMLLHFKNTWVSDLI
jgi:hypothetical protein